MRLTPLDIRKQEFSRRFRGFDAEEVLAFLQMVSNQWEELLNENRRKDEKIRELESKMEHYEKVEEALQEALQTARESSRKALQNAEEKAAMMVEQAENRAEAIKRDAEQERHQIKREAAKLSGRRSEIVTRLRAFLMSEMELLARYEGDDPVGFIKLLPADKQRLRQLSDRLEREEESEAPPSKQESPDDAPEKGVDRSWLDSSLEGVESFFADEAGGSETPTAPEPERHVHDWTKPESAEGYEGGSGRVHEQPGDEPVERAHDEPSESTHAETGEPRDRPHDESGRESRERPDDAAEEEDILRGPGWTAHTVVSRPSEQAGEKHDEEEESPEEAATRAQSEEIEKIRRILSDLD